MLKTLSRRFLKACGEVVDSGEQPEGPKTRVSVFHILRNFFLLFSMSYPQGGCGRLFGGAAALEAFAGSEEGPMREIDGVQLRGCHYNR